jgi:hypothetical protein
MKTPPQFSPDDYTDENFVIFSSLAMVILESLLIPKVISHEGTATSDTTLETITSMLLKYG